MAKFVIPVTYTFTGTFTLRAKSEAQAIEYAEKHCGLVLGGDIHSTLPDDDVDWSFAVHPEFTVTDAIEEIEEENYFCPVCRQTSDLTDGCDNPKCEER